MIDLRYCVYKSSRQMKQGFIIWYSLYNKRLKNAGIFEGDEHMFILWLNSKIKQSDHYEVEPVKEFTPKTANYKICRAQYNIWILKHNLTSL